jgi:hypothetical protein
MSNPFEAAAPPRLTAPPPPAGLDIFEREAADDLQAVFGRRAPQVLQRLALLMFTPDSIVSHRVRRGLEHLAAAQFQPLAVGRSRLEPVRIREMWRAALDLEASPQALERLAICDALMGHTDSLVVLLWDAAAAGGQTGAGRLSALKGSGEPALRSPGSLRSVMGAPDTVFRLVHTSDTPRDLLRELAILLPAATRRSFLEAAETRLPLASNAVVEAARALAPDLAARSFANLRIACGVRAHVNARLAAGVGERAAPLRWLQSALDQVLERRRPISVRRVFRALDEAGLELAPWDRILLGARAFCPARHDA